MLNARRLVLLTFFTAFAAPAVAEQWLLENANLIDVEAGVVREQQFLHISDGRIKRISDQNPVDADGNFRRVDLAGAFVLPGLFDMHVHLATDPSDKDALPLVRRKLEILIRQGVTGVRDMAGDVRQLAYLSRQSRLNEIPAPDIYYSALMGGVSFFDDPRTQVSSKGFSSGQAPWMRAVSQNTNIDLAVAQAMGSGASGIKLYADLTPPLVAGVLNSAQKLGFPVWGHAAVIPAMPNDLVAHGINSVSHAPLLAWVAAEEPPTSGKQRYADVDLNPQHPAFQQLLQDMVANGVYLEPTLNVFRQHRPKAFQNGLIATAAAAQAGVLMIAGTDQNPNLDEPGYAPLVDEMVTLHTEAGVSRQAVLLAATVNAARLLGLDGEVGSVEEGKLANLLIVEANPLQDLNHLRRVVQVYKNGMRIN